MLTLSREDQTIDSEDLLTELEDSSTLTRANSTRHAPADDLSDLDDLLQDSVTRMEGDQQHRADLKARSRGFHGMSQEEVAFCNSRMEAFVQAREWTPVRNLAVFQVYECVCGESQSLFSRFMQEQNRRLGASARRIATIDFPDAVIPTTSVVETRQVTMCTTCAEGKGFSLECEDLEDILKGE